MYTTGWLWCAFMLGWMGSFAIWHSKETLVKALDLVIIMFGFAMILFFGKV